MAKWEELQKLAKEVMAASVDAQFLGLLQVSVYLGMAFEELVREAAEVEKQAKIVRAMVAKEETDKVTGGS